MMSQELLELRQQMYGAHQAFVAAMAEYENAVVGRKLPAIILPVAQQCRRTGAQLDTALSALIQYLEPMKSDEQREAERQRAKTIQATLHRELALVK